MEALEKAKELVHEAYYDERGLADVFRQDAAIWAAIAQAQAAQPRFIRIGKDKINLAQIVGVREYSERDFDGKPDPRLRIDMVVPSAGDTWMISPHCYYYVGAQALAVSEFLAAVMQPMIVGELDLPANPEPQRFPTLQEVGKPENYESLPF